MAWKELEGLGWKSNGSILLMGLIFKLLMLQPGEYTPWVNWWVDLYLQEFVKGTRDIFGAVLYSWYKFLLINNK